MADDLRHMTVSFELYESEEEEHIDSLIDMFEDIVRGLIGRPTDVSWSSRLVPFNERGGDDDAVEDADSRRPPLPGSVTNRTIGHPTITQGRSNGE